MSKPDDAPQDPAPQDSAPQDSAPQDPLAAAREEIAKAQAIAGGVAPPTEDAPKLTSGRRRPRDKKQKEREEDGKSILREFKRAGETRAVKLGALYGWTQEEVLALIAPPPPPEPAAETAGEAPPPADAPPVDAPMKWRLEENPVKPLPKDSPVTPLGRHNGDFFYLDPLNQLRGLSESDHSAAGLRSLFGTRDGIGYLWRNWPKFNLNTAKHSGFDANRVSETLMAACSERGVFRAYERVRGLGAWLTDDGGLVLHHGDRVTIRGRTTLPGEHEGYLYPADQAGLGPAKPDEMAGFQRALDDLLGQFDSWKWRTAGDAGDPVSEAIGASRQAWLLFGWTCCAIVGGALAYRPPIWLTGDAGSGKSMLLDLIKMVVGDLVKSANATQAGIWSTLGASTRAVLIDEAENDPKSQRNSRLVELARQAFSGDVVLRSSSDHSSHQFQARSAFCFSSIIIPPMIGQDVSRIVVLDLDPVGAGGDLVLDAGKYAKIGRMIRRRIVDHWGEWPQRLALWRGVLMRQGHNARGADVFGTMLAMADLVMRDAPWADDVIANVCSGFAPQMQDKTSNAADMLTLLLSKPVEAFRGGVRMMVRDLIERATHIHQHGDSDSEAENLSREGAERALRPFGIFVTRDDAKRWRVILPNKSEGLRMLFEGSQWRTDAGASGGWAQAMRRLPGAAAEKGSKIGGRGWSVPVEVFLMEDET